MSRLSFAKKQQGNSGMKKIVPIKKKKKKKKLTMVNKKEIRPKFNLILTFTLILKIYFLLK